MPQYKRKKRRTQNLDPPFLIAQCWQGLQLRQHLSLIRANRLLLPPAPEPRLDLCWLEI